MAVVYTGGTFDLYHKGHVDLLRRCYKFGEVVVALNTDEFVREYKGLSPVNTYEEREAVLLGCRYVDSVIPNEFGQDSKPTILKVKPDYIVVGSDWLKKDYLAQMSLTVEWLEEQAITLVYVPRVLKLSSTQIKERMK